MQQYLDKKQLANQLSISQKTLLKELRQAMKDGCEAVIKISNVYRIELNGFMSYLVNKNKSKEELKENKIICQKAKMQSEFINEAMSGGFLIHKEESNIANQLLSRIGQKL